MAIFTLDLNPEFLQTIVEEAFLSKNLRLGIILTADIVSPTLHLSNKAAVIAAEYNAGGWVRPNTTIASIGSYASNLWSMTPAQWTINPPATISIQQIFVIRDGTTTPRNATGKFVGFYDFGAGVTCPTGVDTIIDAPFKIKRLPT